MTDEPINFDPRFASVLDWMEARDEQGKIRVEFLSEHACPLDPAKASAWVVKHFKEGDLSPFITLPLALSKPTLSCTDISCTQAGNPMFFWVRMKLDVAQVLNIEPENLPRLQEFFQWADEKSASLGRKHYLRPKLQWFRAGYGSGGKNYGLEWTGVREEPDAQQWQEELSAWREKPWFEGWYQRNIEGLKKLRIGPHCWLTLRSFRGYGRVEMEEFSPKRPSTPSPR